MNEGPSTNRVSCRGATPRKGLPRVRVWPSLSVNLYEMVTCVSKALDLLDPSVAHHHARVAVVASRMARHLGLPDETRANVVIAGALHDAATVLDGPLSTGLDLSFPEPLEPSGAPGTSLHQHALDGALLLGRFSPFAAAAQLIRHHHVSWDEGRGQEFGGRPVVPESHLINLADRIATLPLRADVLSQRRLIVDCVKEASGTLFCPLYVDAFEAVAARESFWLDLAFDAPAAFAEETRAAAPTALGVPELLELAAVLGELIDLRSPFTSTHSAGVSLVAQGLAATLGMSDEDCQLIRVAGLMHDLGKLAVPAALLDKPGRLSPEEYGLVQAHAYHTFQIMKPVRCLETITTWAAHHHERLDGRGYPFRPPELSLGCRVVAVADLFTALSEDRPYRAGMARQAVTALLDEGVATGAIDGDVVAALYRDRERFEFVRRGRSVA